MKTIELINSIDKYVFSSLHLTFVSLDLTKTEIFREKLYISGCFNCIFLDGVGFLLVICKLIKFAALLIVKTTIFLDCFNGLIIFLDCFNA